MRLVPLNLASGTNAIENELVFVTTIATMVGLDAVDPL